MAEGALVCSSVLTTAVLGWALGWIVPKVLLAQQPHSGLGFSVGS